MARVFVSYASDDQEPVDEVHRWLVAESHEVFLDRDLRNGIELGEEWEQRLQERLRWADAVVCVVTSAFLTSKWCPYEVGYARARGSRLLPVLAEPGVDHPLVKSAQYADLTKDPAKARAALLEALRRIDVTGGWGWPDDRSPFPGLRPFDVEYHRVFFGRTGEVAQLAGLLRSPAERAEKAILLIVGPSGCGKSSLVRAGLRSMMANEPGWWTLSPMLPGTDPVAALTRELAAAAGRLQLGWTVAQVRHQLEDTGLMELADELLRAAHAQRLLLVVDQFEELLTQTTSEQRARFGRLLRPALGGPVQVVATLRPEFLNQLLVDAELAMLPTYTYPLRPMSREALRAVIEGPARLAGIGIDDDLVARLVTDTDSGEALPLLAFTLFQLTEGVNRGGKLSIARYEQLGRVQGSLARQADAALAEATVTTGRSIQDVIAGLLRLVTVDEQGRPTRWRVSYAQLPEPVIRELDVFVRRRLLITDTDNGNEVIGVAHEAFLSAWPPLTQAIEKNAVALRARRAVEQAATEWNNAGRPTARLWERGQLAAAVTDTGAHSQAHELVTDHVDLSSTARDFLRISIRRDRLRRGRAITTLSVLLVLALAAAVVAVVEQRDAQKQRDAAVSRQVAGQAMELLTTNPALAGQLSLAAFRLVRTMEARSSLLTSIANPYATRLTAHTSDVYGVAFSIDGRTLATTSGDKTVRLWDLRGPRHRGPMATLADHNDTVRAAAFSPDGQTLATTSADGTAQLWDINDPGRPRRLSILTGHTGGWPVAFSPDGQTLATTSGDSTAQLWDISDPGRPRRLSTFTGDTGVWTMTFSPEGRTLITAGADGTGRLWDVGDPRQPHPLAPLTGHTKPIHSVAFSPDSRILATSSADGTGRLWDVGDPRRPHPLAPLTGHTKPILSVAFSPDGRTLATGSGDDTVMLWDISDPSHSRPLGTLAGHTNSVAGVAFSPDGHTLATASLDHTARLWDLPGPLIAGHTDTVSAVAFSSDKHMLATASFDRTARLWKISDPRRPEPLDALPGHISGVSSVAFSPDDRILATGSFDHTARLWDISNPRRPEPLGTLKGHNKGVYSVAFSPDGDTLATGSFDRTAQLWDISNLRRPEPLGTLKGHNNGVHSVAFSPNGRTLATGSADGTARLWDVNNPRRPGLLNTLDRHDKNDVRSVAFSPNGHTLATGSADGTARLWDVSDLRRPHPLGTLIGHTNIVAGVAFNSDGRVLATASYDATVRLWDVGDLRLPSPLAVLTGHTDTVVGVIFSPDGHTLATAGTDRTARLWESNVDSVAARICNVTPAITKREWDQYLTGLEYRPPCPVFQ